METTAVDVSHIADQDARTGVKWRRGPRALIPSDSGGKQNSGENKPEIIPVAHLPRNRTLVSPKSNSRRNGSLFGQQFELGERPSS